MSCSAEDSQIIFVLFSVSVTVQLVIDKRSIFSHGYFLLFIKLLFIKLYFLSKVIRYIFQQFQVCTSHIQPVPYQSAKNLQFTIRNLTTILAIVVTVCPVNKVYIENFSQSQLEFLGASVMRERERVLRNSNLCLVWLIVHS